MLRFIEQTTIIKAPCLFYLICRANRTLAVLLLSLVKVVLLCAGRENKKYKIGTCLMMRLVRHKYVSWDGGWEIILFCILLPSLSVCSSRSVFFFSPPRQEKSKKCSLLGLHYYIAFFWVRHHCLLVCVSKDRTEDFVCGQYNRARASRLLSCCTQQSPVPAIPVLVVN